MEIKTQLQTPKLEFKIAGNVNFGIAT